MGARSRCKMLPRVGRIYSCNHGENPCVRVQETHIKGMRLADRLTDCRSVNHFAPFASFVRFDRSIVLDHIAVLSLNHYCNYCVSLVPSLLTLATESCLRAPHGGRRARLMRSFHICVSFFFSFSCVYYILFRNYDCMAGGVPVPCPFLRYVRLIYCFEIIISRRAVCSNLNIISARDNGSFATRAITRCCRDRRAVAIPEKQLFAHVNMECDLRLKDCIRTTDTTTRTVETKISRIFFPSRDVRVHGNGYRKTLSRLPLANQ